jgi:hypothetical protein
MYAMGTRCNTGSPSGDRSMGQLDARERQAGLSWGVGEVHSTDEAGYSAEFILMRSGWPRHGNLCRHRPSTPHNIVGV